jgi:hypothetical protein
MNNLASLVESIDGLFIKRSHPDRVVLSYQEKKLLEQYMPTEINCYDCDSCNSCGSGDCNSCCEVVDD